MGNGQCHDCCGNQPRKGWWTNTVGHRRGCALALAIESLGAPVVWERENRSKARREHERRGEKMFREIMQGVVEELKTENGGTGNG
jgi:hypothetical protein